MGYFIHEDQPAGLPLANVDQLNDVNITSPADKDVLAYDATSQKWVNDSSINSALELDYANKVDLSSVLNTLNATYTVPKRGIIMAFATNTANGDGLYVIRNLNISETTYMGCIIYSRDEARLGGTLSNCPVNKGDILRVDGLQNKDLNLCVFIPFK